MPPAGLFENQRVLTRLYSVKYVTATRLQRPTALLYGLRPAPPFGRCATHPPPFPPAGRESFATWQGCGQFRPSACTTHTPALSVGSLHHVKGSLRRVLTRSLPLRSRAAASAPALDLIPFRKGVSPAMRLRSLTSFTTGLISLPWYRVKQGQGRHRKPHAERRERSDRAPNG